MNCPSVRHVRNEILLQRPHTMLLHSCKFPVFQTRGNNFEFLSLYLTHLPQCDFFLLSRLAGQARVDLLQTLLIHEMNIFHCSTARSIFAVHIQLCGAFDGLEQQVDFLTSKIVFPVLVHWNTSEVLGSVARL